MILKSRVGILAKEKGFPNPQALSYPTEITPVTIRNLWKGKINTVRIETLQRVACALCVEVSDLYEIEIGDGL